MASPDPSGASRVKGSATEIDCASTLAFFERRAARCGGEPDITVTSYQDNDPGLAQRRDEAEWEMAEPLLRLSRLPAVLDVGCGVGRWVHHLAGHMASYTGIDFSPRLIDLARMTVASYRIDAIASLQVRSAADLNKPGLAGPEAFGLIIISGVLAYLNDDEVEQCLSGVTRLVASDAVVYVREPVGVNERLTLKKHWSGELGDYYSVIYRKPGYYRQMVVDHLCPLGFDVVHDEPLDPGLQNRSETTQHFLVIDRQSS